MSLDEGLSSYNEGVSGSLPVSHAEEEEKASDYIKKIFGEDLGIILSECALTKPVDPIFYLADLLERLLLSLYSLHYQVNIVFPFSAGGRRYSLETGREAEVRRRRRFRRTDVNGKISHFIEVKYLSTCLFVK